MNHLNQEKINIINVCIDKCEKNIDACQNLIAMCSTRNFEDCAEKIGTFVKIAKENIKACNDCIIVCTEHIKTCSNEDCKKLCKELINICQNCVKAIELCITKCRQSSVDCIRDCEECIEICNICAKSCQNFIDKILKI